MESVEFQGNQEDLSRFARQVLRQKVTIDQPSPCERRIRWDGAERTGFGSAAELRSGIKMSTARLGWAHPWAFRTREAVTPLKLMIGRGAGPRFTLPTGEPHVLGAGALQVRHSTRTVESLLVFDRGGAEFEQLSLELDPCRLKELLGAEALPAPLETLLASDAPVALHEQPLPPPVWRVFDEVLYGVASPASRQLLLEARGLELLALLVDELSLQGEARSSLTSWDIDRLERARRTLLGRLSSPPSLPELARSVGLNEFKLKVGFRTHFGASVFGYLRAQRMEHARHLLAGGRFTVTEVAARVGYENPSKFAAAFRKHFGVPPSALR
jgi:AraC family transcriptional activator of pyochelin receptor